MVGVDGSSKKDLEDGHIVLGADPKTAPLLWNGVCYPNEDKYIEGTEFKNGCGFNSKRI